MNYNFYKSMNLDGSTPPQKLADILDEKITAIQGSETATAADLGEAIAARAILGDPEKKSEYDTALHGPDGVVTIEWIQELAKKKSSTSYEKKSPSSTLPKKKKVSIDFDLNNFPVSSQLQRQESKLWIAGMVLILLGWIYAFIVSMFFSSNAMEEWSFLFDQDDIEALNSIFGGLKKFAAIGFALTNTVAIYIIMETVWCLREVLGSWKTEK
ncbi:hypothetical protein V5S96_05110 [Corynebacterium mastitidis]|uniref:J domain-containing protein n=1 Tax=Corynebacterium mastitidis TaxID=161890 RepID=A0ABU8P0F5_9CORY